MKSFIEKSTGIGTVGTYTISTCKDTPLKLPSRKEQVLISTYFRNLDELIAAKRQEIEKLQNIKQSLLDKMFV